MFSSKLAELFVEINALGVQATAEQLDKLKKSSEAAQAGLNQAQGASVDFGAKALIAYDAAKNAVTGFYQAGIAGTAEMQRFQIQMTFLSREVAAIFTPALDRATEALSGVVGWFRSLSGAQQDNLMHWAMGAAAAATMAATLPKVIAGVKGVGMALRSMIAGGTGGISAILEPLLQLAGAMIGFAIGSGKATGSLGKFWDGLKSIVSGVMDTVMPAISALAEMFTPLIEPVLEVFGELGGILKEVGGLLLDLATFALPILVTWWKILLEAIRLVLDALKQVAKFANDLNHSIFGIQRVRSAENRAGNGHRNVAANDVGFESATAAYSRIQTGFLRATSPERIAKQQLDVQKTQLTTLQKIEHNTAGGALGGLV